MSLEMRKVGTMNKSLFSGYGSFTENGPKYNLAKKIK